MRKIISILVALGLILGLSVMATPVSADVTTPSVSLTTDCANATANYTITFNITASLTQGLHSVCIRFPAGTTVPTTFATGAITINGIAVFGAEVTVSATEVCFLVPVDFLPPGPIVVVVSGIRNPVTPGSYRLEVRTTRKPDEKYVLSGAYIIRPAVSVYDFMWDSSPTYPGIAFNFTPPFKACGQNVTYEGGEGPLTLPDIGFANRFNFILRPVIVGCAPPCLANVTVMLRLVAAPTGSRVRLGLNNVTNITHTLPPGANVTVGVYPLGTNDTLTWTNVIHFDTVGSYRICLEAICPILPVCAAPGANLTIADECFDIKVYQWKDAAKLTLNEKWNLISLPLVPFDASILITEALASIPSADRADIVSIWYFDRCVGVNGTWYSWPAPGPLTRLEAGKAYWVRTTYPQADCGNITWWVWGTEKPMPPAAPAEYRVCRGWNMFGFLSTADKPVQEYLWNWAAQLPVVYGWAGGPCWTAQNWRLIPAGTNLTVGQGYWGAFPADGAIYVP